MDHFNEGGIWPCVLGGVAVGAFAMFGLVHVWKPSKCAPKTVHKKAFLIVVNVTCPSPDE